MGSVGRQGLWGGGGGSVAFTSAVWCLQVLHQVAHQSLTNPMLLPSKARRALFVSLSDLALRCWAGQPAAAFDNTARTAQFAMVVDPLLQCLWAAAAAGQGTEVAAVAVRAAAAASSIVQVWMYAIGHFLHGWRDVVIPLVMARSVKAAPSPCMQSYSGSPRSVRSIVTSVLGLPALACVVPIIIQQSRGTHRPGKLAAAMLHLLSSTLESLGTELPTSTVEQLLGSLLHVLGSTGKNWWWRVDSSTCPACQRPLGPAAAASPDCCCRCMRFSWLLFCPMRRWQQLPRLRS